MRQPCLIGYCSLITSACYLVRCWPIGDWPSCCFPADAHMDQPSGQPLRQYVENNINEALMPNMYSDMAKRGALYCRHGSVGGQMVSCYTYDTYLVKAWLWPPFRPFAMRTRSTSDQCTPSGSVLKSTGGSCFLLFLLTRTAPVTEFVVCSPVWLVRFML